MSYRSHTMPLATPQQQVQGAAWPYLQMMSDLPGWLLVLAASVLLVACGCCCMTNLSCPIHERTSTALLSWFAQLIKHLLQLLALAQLKACILAKGLPACTACSQNTETTLEA